MENGLLLGGLRFWFSYPENKSRIAEVRKVILALIPYLVKLKRKRKQLLPTDNFSSCLGTDNV